MVFWPAFTGSLSIHELFTGVAALALTLWFLRALDRCVPVPVRFRFHDILQLWHLPGEILSDVARLTVRLLQELFGLSPAPERFRLLRWSAHATSQEARGREVLLTTLLSATPNSIVLGIDSQESLLVLHELTPVPASTMAKALGAQP